MSYSTDPIGGAMSVASTKQTWRDVRLESAFGGRADVICSERVFPVLTHLYGPAVRCKPDVNKWRGWSCASVSGPCMERLWLLAIMDICAHPSRTFPRSSSEAGDCDWCADR